MSMYWQALSDGWLTADDYLSWGVFQVPKVNLSGAFTLLVQIARWLEMDWEENEFTLNKSKSAVKNDQLCPSALTIYICKQRQRLRPSLDHIINS